MTATTMAPVNERNLTGAACWLAFMLTIPLANWTLERYGLWNFPWLGPVPSGVIWVGLAFVLRDVVQLTIGRWAVLAGIIIGTFLSWYLASPTLAVASACAFAVSELMDWVIYTPLATRRFVAAVIVSGCIGSLLDSAIFVRIAFHSYDGWWELAVVKSAIVILAMPFAWWVRNRVVPRHFAR